MKRSKKRSPILLDLSVVLAFIHIHPAPHCIGTVQLVFVRHMTVQPSPHTHGVNATLPHNPYRGSYRVISSEHGAIPAPVQHWPNLTLLQVFLPFPAASCDHICMGASRCVIRWRAPCWDSISRAMKEHPVLYSRLNESYIVLWRPFFSYFLLSRCTLPPCSFIYPRWVPVYVPMSVDSPVYCLFSP